MLRVRSDGGLTVVELMVGLAVVAIVAALAAPNMATWLHNSKITNTTQDLFAGLQGARAEAIRRNLQVDFVVTDSPVNQADLANTLAPSVNGANWAVRAASDVVGAPFVLIEAKSGNEGANSGTSTRAATVVGASPGGFTGTLSFNGFGGTTDGNPYTFDVSNAAAGACVAGGGDIRCKRVAVTAGGRISACDPAAPAGDSRACPP